MYLQKLWLPSPSSNASVLQALYILRLTAGESHGRQREPLLVTDAVPRYCWPEPSAHSLCLSAPKSTYGQMYVSPHLMVFDLSTC